MFWVNATSGGVKEFRKVFGEAEALRATGLGAAIFVDEAHRLAKNQIEALLPVLENGLLVGILATTERAGFSFPRALISRCEVVEMNLLDEDALRKLLVRATKHEDGVRLDPGSITPEGWQALVATSEGDGRQFLLSIEALDTLNLDRITLEVVRETINSGAIRYDDKTERYQLLSWLQKAIRLSDPNAAMIALARLLEGGEDPRVVIRRLYVMASEDIGLADSNALVMVDAAREAFERVGAPEGHIPLGHLVSYMAMAPKSDAAYRALKRAKEIVRTQPNLKTPKVFQNAVTDQDRADGLGEGYRHPFTPEGYEKTHSTCLPKELEGLNLFE